MPTRLVLGSLAIVVACAKPHDDHPIVDGAQDLTDASLDPDSPSVDAAPDAWVPDLLPPTLAAVTPGTGAAVWLHAPIRLTFSEPLAQASIAMTVTAKLAGTPVPAQIAFDPPSSLVVTLGGGVRGVGSLEVALTGSVADLAGNTYAAPIDLTFVAPPWSAVAIDRGYAASAPELAVAGDGSVWAAWLVGNAGSRRAVISALAGNTWLDAGGPLGSGDVSSVALAIDQDGTTLAAWADSGVAHVARWTATGWSEWTSPGAASHVALATPPSGAPMLALFGATAGVRRLEQNAWQPLGTDITLTAPLAGPPALAAGSDGHPAIGWIDTLNMLSVYRFDTSWTAIDPIAVGPGSRMALAARGATLALAWDQYAASFGVLAAELTGSATTWTKLGRALDIDIMGNAIAPAVSLDASGAPIVAWTELVETHQRGAIARWSGSAWTIVGGITWLDDTVSAPTRTRIALHAGDAAVVATSAAGTIRVARFNGPRTASVGIAQRASIAGCSFDAANPPANLSQTGCFNLASPMHPVPHPGLVPFDVISELWTDGAKKRRYLGLPDGAGMTLQANGSWLPPNGTLMIKQFDLETTPGDPETRRPIETRFLVFDAALGLKGFSYMWNAAGTDATLLADTVYTFDWPMDDGSIHEHQYPSRQHCVSCHHSSMGPLLGVRSEQLARWNDYGGVIADQLQTLSALGIAPVSSATPFMSAHQPGETAERRMRGYMAGNCAHCHNPQYLSIKDLRYTTPLSQTHLCDAIVPGDAPGSKVYQLVNSRPGMPCLGTLAVDPLAVQLLGTWIDGMTSCP